MVWPPACGDKARWFGDGDSRVLSVCVGVPRSVTHDAMVFLFFTVRPYLGENPECASGHMSGAVVDLVCSDQLS